MTILSKSVVLAVISAAVWLLFSDPVSAIHPPQLRARRIGSDQLEVLHKLNKRWVTCAMGGYCEEDSTCCGIWCCNSYQSCYGTPTADTLAYCGYSTTSTTAGDSFPTTTGYSFPTYTDNASNSGHKPFSQWSTGAKIAVIVAPVLALGLIGGSIALLVYCCCKKRRAKKAVVPGAFGQPIQGVQQMQPMYTGTTQYMGATNPHMGMQSPPPTTMSPAPPYDYSVKPEETVYVNPNPGPQYNAQMGGYVDGQQQVFEAPNGQMHR